MASDVRWIKITTDMFDNRKIRHLRRLPEGNNIVLIWVMLLTMAGRCNSNGMIFLTENIPYTPKMLADELDFEENTVKLALTVLEQLDMVVMNQGYFAIAGWNEHQNVEGLDKIREQNRIRQQKRREKTKQALIGSGNVCEYCGQVGSTVDHIIPKAKGGLDVPENTVCSCLTCNMTKSDRSIDAFLNEMIVMDSGFDITRILSNSKIMKYVVYDGQRFVSRDITLHVTQSHATEEDKEKDIDIEEDKKSVRETTPTLLKRLLPDYIIPEVLAEKMGEWITYKMERKEPYKEQGMKSLLRQIENNQLQYGEKAVCDLIDESMANGWKGIIFDRLKQKPIVQRQNRQSGYTDNIRNRVTDVDNW